MTKTSFTFPCSDGEHTIAARRWDPEGTPRAVVQLVHGMVEFIDRYDAFASLLCDHGFLVVGFDLLAHGDSVNSHDEWGVLEAGKGKEVLIADIHHLRENIVAEVGPAVPYIMFGHSMGSFLTRAYIARFGEGLHAAIICGTGQTPKATAVAGNLLARLIASVKGDAYCSTFLHNMADGAYGKAFQPSRTPYDWLSRNTENVDRYAAEPRNTFMFSAGGYVELTSLVREIIKPSTFEATPKELPLLIMSGEKDPVGDFGKGPTAVASLYEKHGCEDVTLRLYPDDRHEILNEVDRAKVQEDTLGWIEEHLK